VRRLLPTAILTGLLLLAGAQSAQAHFFSVKVSPSSAAAGARTTFSVTIVNQGGPGANVNSVDLTAPAGFTLVSAIVPGAGTATIDGSKVKLRNLGLGPHKSVTATVVADVPCTTGTKTWGVSSPDRPFDAAHSARTTTVTGSCATGTALRFVGQPPDGAVGSPFGVSVEVVDASGNRVTGSAASVTLTLQTLTGSGTLGGTTTRTAVNGLVTFTGLTVSGPGTFRLVASSPGLTPASSVFRIDTVNTVCPENQTCTATTSTATTTASITALGDPARADTGILTLSFNSGPPLDCAGYTELTPDTALFDLRGGDRAKIATLIIDKAAVHATADNGAKHLELCFEAPRPFTTKSGAQAAPSGTFDWNADGVPEPAYAGLLPGCRRGAPGPCITKRKKVGGGDGYVEARIPLGLGDPRMRG
jgi:hypothetical protein